MATILALGAGAAMWLLSPGGAAPEVTPSGPPSPKRTASASTKAVAGRASVATRLYAVAVDEPPALPPDATPGTRVELWVAWDRPDPERPRLEKLLPVVTLDEIIPAFTPGGPDAAMLRVETSQIPKLVRAERHGTLEVRLPGSRPVE